MRRILKTQFGTYAVEDAQYNNGILFVKVVGEYDHDGNLRYPLPYTMNVGGSHELRPALTLVRDLDSREREADSFELEVEDFLR